MTSQEKSIRLHDTLQTLNTLFSTLETETEEGKNRFINFVRLNDVENYIELPYRMTKESIEFMGSYDVNPEDFFLMRDFSSPHFVFYVHEYMEGSDVFCIPVAYFDDPEKWEQDLLARIVSDAIVVEKARRKELLGTFSPFDKISPICTNESQDDLLVEFYDPNINAKRRLVYYRKTGMFEGLKGMKHLSMHCLNPEQCRNSN